MTQHQRRSGRPIRKQGRPPENETSCRRTRRAARNPVGRSGIPTPQQQPDGCAVFPVAVANPRSSWRKGAGPPEIAPPRPKSWRPAVNRISTARFSVPWRKRWRPGANQDALEGLRSGWREPRSGRLLQGVRRATPMRASPVSAKPTFRRTRLRPDSGVEASSVPLA